MTQPASHSRNNDGWRCGGVLCCLGGIRAQVPKRTDADDRDPIGRPHTVLHDRCKHRGTRAHQRSGMLGLDLVRQRKGELPVVDSHVGGETTVVAAEDGQPPRPTLSRSTSVPTAATTPTTSCPGTNGY